MSTEMPCNHLKSGNVPAELQSVKSFTILLCILCNHISQHEHEQVSLKRMCITVPIYTQRSLYYVCLFVKTAKW